MNYARFKKIPWKLRWVLYIKRIQAAFILWRERRRAGLSIDEAATVANLDRDLLRKYEMGILSPPLFTVASLLRGYRASDSAMLFFCTFRISAMSLGQIIRGVIRY